MDLAGLLLDEEGTFSLTGFQDFSVRALPGPSPASPHLEPGPRALPSGPSGATSSPDSQPGSWEAAARAVPPGGPGCLGPGEQLRGTGLGIEVASRCSVSDNRTRGALSGGGDLPLWTGCHWQIIQRTRGWVGHPTY